MRAIIVALLCLTFTFGSETERIQKAGDFIELALPATGLLATALFEEGEEGAWQWFYSNGSTAFLTQLLKLGIHKERPDGSDDNSFPSGHTSAAFVGATFLERRYGWKVGVPAYLLASFVGYSRIRADKHYDGDVLAGALIGIGFGYGFTTPYKGVVISPEMGESYLGAKLKYRF